MTEAELPSPNIEPETDSSEAKDYEDRTAARLAFEALSLQYLNREHFGIHEITANRAIADKHAQKTQQSGNRTWAGPALPRR